MPRAGGIGPTATDAPSTTASGWAATSAATVSGAARVTSTARSPSSAATTSSTCPVVLPAPYTTSGSPVRSARETSARLCPRSSYGAIASASRAASGATLPPATCSSSRRACSRSTRRPYGRAAGSLAACWSPRSSRSWRSPRRGSPCWPWRWRSSCWCACGPCAGRSAVRPPLPPPAPPRESRPAGDDALRHVALVRYDAFEDIGGGQSFSAALLDERGDGVVLTSIHGRGESRTYGKSVRGGTSEHTLSPEEQQAIAQARA